VLIDGVDVALDLLHDRREHVIPICIVSIASPGDFDPFLFIFRHSLNLRNRFGFVLSFTSGRLLGLKMINGPVNNLQIKLLEGPDSLINFALSQKFDEHLSLPRSGRRARFPSETEPIEVEKARREAEEERQKRKELEARLAEAEKARHQAERDKQKRRAPARYLIWLGIFLVVGLFQQLGHQHTAGNQVRATPNESTPQPDLGATPQTSPSLAPAEKVPADLVQSPSPKPLVSSGLPAATPTPALDAKEYFDIGKASYDKKLYENAISDFSNSIRLDPNYAPAYYYRGRTYATQGELGKAISDYNEVIRLDPNDADAYYYRGRAYADEGEFDRAISDYNEAIRLDSNDADAYYHRGVAYSLVGNHHKADADFAAAKRLKKVPAGLHITIPALPMAPLNITGRYDPNAQP
jgi:tetratricopeptide (TPR) repeat protein